MGSDGQTVTREEILAAVLAPPPVAPATDIEAVLATIEADDRDFERDIDLALVHAPRFDRLGFAFAAGYLAATRALIGSVGLSLPRGSRISLLATEEGGAHPRAIRTTLEGGKLNGAKVWSTLATVATHLLVIAREGEEAGRPKLRAVLVPAGREGVSIEPMPPTPFCPEIQHARVELRGVDALAADVLPNDAFTGVLKPFRTIEDLCIHGSVLAWLAATSRRLGMDRRLAARAVTLALAVRELDAMSPSSKVTHVALGGLLEASSTLVAEIDAAWPEEPRDERERFARDRPLFDIARRVREERLKRAWESLDDRPST